MKETLAIITVIYGHYDLLDDFLKSFRDQTDQNFHLFFVDTSKQKQPIVLKDLPNTVIQTENKGYADGVNIGIAQAQEEGYSYYCIMNYDVIVEKNFVKNIVKDLENHPSSIIGGKIY